MMFLTILNPAEVLLPQNMFSPTNREYKQKGNSIIEYTSFGGEQVSRLHSTNPYDFLKTSEFSVNNLRG